MVQKISPWDQVLIRPAYYRLNDDSIIMMKTYVIGVKVSEEEGVVLLFEFEAIYYKFSARNDFDILIVGCHGNILLKWCLWQHAE